MKISVRGMTSLTQRTWIAVERGGLTAYISPKECSSPQRLKCALADAGIVIASRKESDALLDAIDAIPDYLPSNLADGLGWNGPCFRMPSGEVFSPPGIECVSVYAAPALSSPPADDLRGWQREVVKPLAENPLALFALILAFAGPLLKLVEFDHVPAFEIVAGAATGKSTLQRLALNTAMSVCSISPACSLAAHGDTAKAPEQHARGAKDTILVLDSGDREMVTQKPEQRRTLYRGIEKVASGDAGRYFTLLSTSRESLGGLLGNEAPRALTYQRVLTIDVTKGRPHGVFDLIPERFESASAFADHLRLQSSNFRGLPFREFIKHLVLERSEAPEQLVRRIGRSMATFRKHAGSDDNNGEERRRVDCFAIVYAAACLAREYGVLPSDGPFASKGAYGKAILACYDLHRGFLPSTVPFEERLVQAARAPGTLVATTRSRTAKLRPKTISKADVLVSRRAGRHQLLVRSEAIEKVFYDWKAIKDRPKVKERQIEEKGRIKIKRSVAGVALGRVFAFRLPDGWRAGSGLFE